VSISTVVGRIAEIESMLGGTGTSQRANTLGGTGTSTPGTSTPGTSTPANTSFGAALARVSAGSGNEPARRGVLAGVPYANEIAAAATKYGVDPALIRAVIEHESGFNPRATSHAGAQGLMQLMPDTARGLGVSDPYDPAQSIDGGTHYLADQLARYHGDVRLALAAYNAGPGAVARFGGVPPYPETVRYVKSILSQLGGLHMTPTTNGGAR
jgi:peptidoglycan DL-endopeptidase CwlO